MLNKIKEEPDRVLMWRPCPTCVGKGAITQTRCAVCGLPVSSALVGGEAVLCSHSGEALVEWVLCPDCDGQRRTAQWVSRAEYGRLRRRAVLRGLFLLLAGAIPFIILALAIATSENTSLCGSWWYALLLAALIRMA